MPTSPLYGFFSPAIPEEKGQIGIPSSAQTFSQQLRFLNQHLFLPHKENGDLSELSYSDQVYVCRINSDDRIRVGDRIVLFPNQTHPSLNFPLLVSEKKAKRHMHEVLLKVLAEDGDHDQFHVQDKADYISTYVGLIAVVDKLKPVLAARISRWLEKNQNQLDDDLAEDLTQMTGAWLSTAHAHQSADEPSPPPPHLENLLRHFDNFSDTFYLKTVGLVICLIETEENYATFGDLVQVKLRLNG